MRSISPKKDTYIAPRLLMHRRHHTHSWGRHAVWPSERWKPHPRVHTFERKVEITSTKFILRFENWSINQSIEQSHDHLVKEWIDQSINQSMAQSNNLTKLSLPNMAGFGGPPPGKPGGGIPWCGMKPPIACGGGNCCDIDSDGTEPWLMGEGPSWYWLAAWAWAMAFCAATAPSGIPPPKPGGGPLWAKSPGAVVVAGCCWACTGSGVGTTGGFISCAPTNKNVKRIQFWINRSLSSSTHLWKFLQYIF